MALKAMTTVACQYTANTVSAVFPLTGNRNLVDFFFFKWRWLFCMNLTFCTDFLIEQGWVLVPLSEHVVCQFVLFREVGQNKIFILGRIRSKKHQRGPHGSFWNNRGQQLCHQSEH